MSKISLTASMRSNLLSLQNISKQSSCIQNRLSTGLKVNSAIDNPSSYYTARSLSNRANDLDALLDTMGQALNTVKAATHGIESASVMLEQMRAVTEQTLTEAQFVPHRVEVDYDPDVQKLIDAGYEPISSQTTLTRMQELLADSNAKVVLVEDVTLKGQINVAGANAVINGGGHTLKCNGVYFNAANGTLENARIENAVGTSTLWSRSVYGSNGLTVKNVEINHQNTVGRPHAIETWGRLTVENVNINLGGNFVEVSGLRAYGGGSISNVNVTLTAQNDEAVMAGISSNNNTLVVDEIGVTAKGGQAYGIIGPTKTLFAREAIGGTDHIPSSLFDGKANTDAIVGELGADGGAAYAANQFAIAGVAAGDTFGQGTWYLPSIAELMQVYGTNTDGMSFGYGTSGVTGDNKALINAALTTAGGDTLSSGYYWSSSEYGSSGSWLLNMRDGYRYSYYKNSYHYVRCFQLLENCFDPLTLSAGTSGDGSGVAVPKVGDIMYSDKTWGTTSNHATATAAGKVAVGVITDVSDTGDVTIMNLNDLGQMAWSTGSNRYKDIPDIENVYDFELLRVMNPNAQVVSLETLNAAYADLAAEKYQAQYNDILSQYDSVINDSSYKGVNLLKNDTLQVRFNENSTSSIDVKGKNLSSGSLGLSLADWAEKEGILQSIKELSTAVAELRSFSSELGNNYSVISTRQEFTENLINVLTEGADKLTLADMNEESANMLALQTGQQLAVNALSLASQSAQSVLKLF